MEESRTFSDIKLASQTKNTKLIFQTFVIKLVDSQFSGLLIGLSPVQIAKNARVSKGAKGAIPMGEEAEGGSCPQGRSNNRSANMCFWCFQRNISLLGKPRVKLTLIGKLFLLY
jgi:hypothetical protein